MYSDATFTGDSQCFGDGDKRWTTLLEKRYLSASRGCCFLVSEHKFCPKVRKENMYCANHQIEAERIHTPYKAPPKVLAKERNIMYKSKLDSKASGSPAKKKKQTQKETPDTVKRWLNDVIRNQDVLLTHLKTLQKKLDEVNAHLITTDSNVKTIGAAIGESRVALNHLLESDLIVDLSKAETMNVKVKKEKIAKK